MAKECSVGGCHSIVRAHGFCGAHVARYLRHGDPLGGPRGPRRDSRATAPGTRCSIDGCTAPAYRRAYCSSHHYRWRRYGDPLGGRRGRLRPRGSRWFDHNGYAMVRRDGANVFEHRYVMEGVLGRPLWPDERVHHLNGDRTDNRPENLELWSTAQPAGQRVEDKVAFAVTILERYAPDLLAKKRHNPH